jgi:predicted DNA-binding protein YlxM (UPF0122 family)
MIGVHKRKLFNLNALSQTEMRAVAQAIEESVGFGCDWIEEEFGEKDDRFDGITSLGVNCLLRIFLHYKLPTAYGSHLKKDSSNNLVYQVMKEYLPAEIETQELEQKSAIDKRIERVNKRITDLQQKKKLLNKAKPAEKKSATKKSAKAKSKK